VLVVINMQLKVSADNNIYIGPNCQKKGKGITIWKPSCRLPGCKKPARLAKANASKYCSDEHGEEFMSRLINKSDDATKEFAIGGSLRKGEVAAAADHANGDIDEFRRLGNSTPGPEIAEEIEFTDEEQQRLDKIREKQETIQTQRQVLNDRERFLQLCKDRAKRIVLEEQQGTTGAKAGAKGGKKGSGICGYDSRLSWDEERYRKWQKKDRRKKQRKVDEDGDIDFVDLGAKKENGHDDGEKEPEIEGGNIYAALIAAEPTSLSPSKAHQNGTVDSSTEKDHLAPDSDDTDDSSDEVDVICKLKTCSCHSGWAKVVLEEIRFEEVNLNERSVTLGEEQRAIHETARLRTVKSKDEGREGQVEAVS
jgi:COMPASS component SPP1